MGEDESQISEMRAVATDVVEASDRSPGPSVAREVDKETALSLAEKSDRDYREITKRIIMITYQELKERAGTKKPLRTELFEFIRSLLTLQFVFLMAMLVSNVFSFGIAISDSIFEVYIVSVFAETLAGLLIVVKFAFNSEEETKLIAVLNSIVEHFQKYDEKK